MVRDVLLDVGENQKQLEHAITLVGIGLIGALFEILDHRESIGEQPFETRGVYGAAAAATLEGVVGAHESFVEEVIEAKLFGGKSPRDLAGTSVSTADSLVGWFHGAPHVAGAFNAEVRARLTQAG
jgi:hypothetical protein